MLWIDSTGGLHDDMNGDALLLPIWPKGMTLATPVQIASFAAAQSSNSPPDPIAVLQQQMSDLQAQLAAVVATNPTMSAAMASVKV